MKSCPTRSFLGRLTLLCGAGALLASSVSAQVYADQVVSYTPGTGVNSSYTNPAVALGQPGGNVGTATLNPFSPNFAASELVQVGFGGELTLRLSNYVTVNTTPGVREIGIYENVGLISTGGTTGQAGNPATVFGADSAVVSVSENGAVWFTLNAGQPILFNLPSNFYANATGLNDAPPANPQFANFGQPFTGTLADFDGQTFAGALGALNGSAGGTWLDLDSTGLSHVGYIRFSGVASGSTLEVNGVSINSALVGGVVPEPSIVALMLVALALAAGLRRKLRVGPRSAAIALALSLLFRASAPGQTFLFEDIQNWTGTGSNQAAMVVDWNDGKGPESLAWGYRWDGTATGLQMIQAIAQNDPRFFLALTNAFGSPFVFGIGYDLNGNGGTFTPGTVGNETGSASDPFDHYAEGVFTKFWGYLNGVGNPFNGGSWTEAQVGAGDRVLTNGSWDGWSLSTDIVNFTIPLPNPPTAAAPVPEPAMVWLCVIGLGATLVAVRQRVRLAAQQ